MVEVVEDFVMQRVIREQGALLVDRIDDQGVLETAWRVLHRGQEALPDSAELKPALCVAFAQVQPYRLAYEGWRTLQEYLEPPKPPSPELARLARKLDSFFGVDRAKQRIES